MPTVLYASGYAYRGPNTPDAGGGVRLGQGDYRNEGYNVLTWDPRGFGGSGGISMFDSPAYEARDVQALIDWVATQPEALLDAPGDPRVAMTGASYGGAIELITAAIEPRVDAIVPDAAWNSLDTAFAHDGGYKAGWLVPLCAVGAGFGLLDGVTDGVSGPTGIQIGGVDSRFLTMCAEGAALGRLSPATTQWMASIGPGALVSAIRAPTLLLQGTVDTLFAAGRGDRQLRATARKRRSREDAVVLRRPRDLPDAPGDTNHIRDAALNWLRRWLKPDATIDTGPRFEWVDDGGVWRSGPDYPLTSAGALAASGSGSLTVLPTVTVTAGSTVISTPVLGMVERRYSSLAAERDIVGEPTLTLTYRGFALPSTTFLYAQVADVAAGRVVGQPGHADPGRARRRDADGHAQARGRRAARATDLRSAPADRGGDARVRTAALRRLGDADGDRELAADRGRASPGGDPRRRRARVAPANVMPRRSPARDRSRVGLLGRVGALLLARSLSPDRARDADASSGGGSSSQDSGPLETVALRAHPTSNLLLQRCVELAALRPAALPREHDRDLRATALPLVDAAARRRDGAAILASPAGNVSPPCSTGPAEPVSQDVPSRMP